MRQFALSSLLTIAAAAAIFGGWFHSSAADAWWCKRDCGPTTPSKLVVSPVSGTSLKVGWSPSTERNGTIVGYRVYVGNALATTVGGTSVTLSNLSCATSYTIAVVAVDDGGGTSKAASASGTTGACPAPAPTPAPTPSPSPAPAPLPAVWQPKPGTTWQWQITGVVDQSLPVQMYDIDLFDAQPSAGTPAAPTTNALTWVSYPSGSYTGPTVTRAGNSANPGIIASLHQKGIKVLCYMDSGAWESYRPDAAQFPTAVIGNSTGWSGERWLDIRQSAWSQFEWIIVNRMLLAKESGCDGIEPDQNNPVGNNPGFSISYADEKAWYLEVARDAHALGLTVLMKNGIELLPDAQLVSEFDGALNEQCFQYNECSELTSFVAAGKAVFQVEYQGNPTVFCPQAQTMGFSSMLKNLSLDAWQQPCW